MSKLVHEQETYLIRGAAFEVFNEMGSGFGEGVYQECLELAFAERAVEFEAQPRVPVFFKQRKLRKRYVPDFICFGSIIVEIKAIDQLTGHDTAQMLSYLKATGFKLGLLTNFGNKRGIEIQRVLL